MVTLLEALELVDTSGRTSAGICSQVEEIMGSRFDANDMSDLFLQLGYDEFYPVSAEGFEKEHQQYLLDAHRRTLLGQRSAEYVRRRLDEWAYYHLYRWEGVYGDRRRALLNEMINYLAS